jgi:hypothetical protein
MMPTKNIRIVPYDEVAVLQQIAVQKRPVGGGYGVDDKEVETEPGDGRLDPDLGRAEPILELAAVEQHLQRADRQAQHGEAEEVE